MKTPDVACQMRVRSGSSCDDEMKSAGSTLDADKASDAQEKCRAMPARGGREKFPKGARLRPRCESDGDVGSTSGAQVRLGGDKERVGLDEGFSNC